MGMRIEAEEGESGRPYLWCYWNIHPTPNSTTLQMEFGIEFDIGNILKGVPI